MPASCQLVDSMFEVRPIGTRTKFKPVKKPEAEIPSVELVAELVEVQLEELRFYVMVSVQYSVPNPATMSYHRETRQNISQLVLPSLRFQQYPRP